MSCPLPQPVKCIINGTAEIGKNSLRPSLRMHINDFFFIKCIKNP